MTNIKHLIQTNLAAFAVIAACGCTSSSIEGSERLVALNTDQQTNLCDEMIAQYPPHMVTCSDGTQQTRGSTDTVAQCVAALQDTSTQVPSCEATVDDYESCIEAITELPGCTVAIPPACTPLFSGPCVPPKPPTKPDLRFPLTIQSGLHP